MTTYSQDGREATIHASEGGFLVVGNFGEKPFACETQVEAEDCASLWAFHGRSPFARKTAPSLTPVS